MIKKIRVSFSLLDSRSKFLVRLFAFFRIFLAILDIVGIVLMGLLLTRVSQNYSKEPTESNFFAFQDFTALLTTFQLSMIALAAFLLKSAFSVAFMKLMVDTIARAETKVTNEIFKQFFLLSRNEISIYSKSDISFILTYSSSAAITNLLTAWVTIVSELALLIGIGILFAFVNLNITLTIFVYFILIGLGLYRVLGKKMQTAGNLYVESVTSSSGIAQDSISAIREILTMHKENEFVAKFSKSRKNFAQAAANISFYSSMPRYIIESGLMLGTAALATYVFLSANQSEMFGLLGIFLTGGLRISASIIPLQSALGASRQYIAQAEPFFTLIQNIKLKNSSFKCDLSNIDEISIPPSINFKDVSYTYPGSNHPAIKDLSLSIASGEFTAFIGPSGSGKSTIADLIIGFINPTEGEILYSESQAPTCRIGYVPQSPGLIEGTILENITLNIDSLKYDPYLIENVLNSSHLSNLINSLDGGIDSNLGAQSDSLSGGQLQRIGVARALYANPQLLVLDEATSALDAETEKVITDTFENLKGKCTLVVIAHRLSTVQHADMIHIVENGQVVASGKFTELATSNELLARYIELSEIEKD